MNAELNELATGHKSSRFAADVRAHASEIRAAFAGRRVLVIGGAGSIGSSTIRALVPFAPAAIHVIDQNENGLAELVRDLRSSDGDVRDIDLRLMPLDYGAPVAARFISASGPYDAILHFAALKHVRSEKDPASILQMLDTNVVKQARLMSWLATSKPQRYFAVSTDKAADPVNFMGASKRLMEHVVFTDGITPLDAPRFSARFANVAFSAGSLLESWGERLRRRQPIAVPKDTYRYFVSLEEAAEICLLAASCLPDKHVAVPSIGRDMVPRELLPIAEAFLRTAGYQPSLHEDEGAARAAAARANGSWPILVTPRDTDGEKASEEFVGVNERSLDIGLTALRGVPQTGVSADVLRGVLDELASLIGDAGRPTDKQALQRLIARAVPEFQPATSGRSLDERM